MPASRADLAHALAPRLPGDWHSTYHQHATYSQQFPLDDFPRTAGRGRCR
ncbi:hypothetical protein [Streptomyces sp. KN37]|nr:hypothetical protein [Streptomyces sp. KN37]WPO76174.1 hypothetical protein R9806_35690 [Streptomyces sp. KN37]